MANNITLTDATDTAVTAEIAGQDDAIGSFELTVTYSIDDDGLLVTDVDKGNRVGFLNTLPFGTAPVDTDEIQEAVAAILDADVLGTLAGLDVRPSVLFYNAIVEGVGADVINELPLGVMLARELSVSFNTADDIVTAISQRLQASISGNAAAEGLSVLLTANGLGSGGASDQVMETLNEFFDVAANSNKDLVAIGERLAAIDPFWQRITTPHYNFSIDAFSYIYEDIDSFEEWASREHVDLTYFTNNDFTELDLGLNPPGDSVTTFSDLLSWYKQFCYDVMNEVNLRFLDNDEYGTIETDTYVLNRVASADDLMNRAFQPLEITPYIYGGLRVVLEDGNFDDTDDELYPLYVYVIERKDEEFVPMTLMIANVYYEHAFLPLNDPLQVKDSSKTNKELQTMQAEIEPHFEELEEERATMKEFSESMGA